MPRAGPGRIDDEVRFNAEFPQNGAEDALREWRTAYVADRGGFAGIGAALCLLTEPR